MSTPKKKPAFPEVRLEKDGVKLRQSARKAKPAKKPAARPIPPPPPGWEIVAKDDPRLDCLPCRPMCLHRVVGWIPDPISEVGKVIDPHSRAVFTFALPVAQPPAPQPPMIRLRLPSEKPTREDGDKMGDIATWGPDGVNFARWDADISDVYAWAPGRLPDGILPREPSQEEKWEAEAALAYSRLPEATRPNRPGFIDGFLAAKKGGAE